MTYLLALVAALGVILSVSAAATIPEENDVFSPPMLVARGSPEPRKYPLQNARGRVHHVPPADSIDPTTGSSLGRSPAPPIPSFGPQPATDPITVSAADANEGPKRRLRRSAADRRRLELDQGYIWSGIAPWFQMLSGQVVIYTDDWKFLSVGRDVRWEKEGREGPVFSWSSELGDSEKLFLEPIKVEDNKVSEYAGGALAVMSSNNNTRRLRDSHGELTFHFIAADEHGLRQRIYFSRNGVPCGPPGHLENHTDTKFNVRLIGKPANISAFKILTYDSTTYNTTTEFATTVCSGSQATYDYTGNDGDSCELQLLGGMFPGRIPLQPPLPGIADRTWKADLQERGRMVKVFQHDSSWITHPSYRATLVVATKKEVYSRIVWTATMKYREEDISRVVAGESYVWHIDELISTRAYPGELFSPETCIPILEFLKIMGTKANGGRRTLFDNKDVDYQSSEASVDVTSESRGI